MCYLLSTCFGLLQYLALFFVHYLTFREGGGKGGPGHKIFLILFKKIIRLQISLGFSCLKWYLNHASILILKEETFFFFFGLVFKL